MEIDSEYKVYPTRFAVVTMYGFSQFMISVLLNTLNPIAAYLCYIYNQTPLVVNLGGLLFALMHPIFTFPASYVIDTYGTRVGIAIGSILALIGVSLRMLVNKGFAWVIIGQVIAGIGRPFILNCQAKVSANWFTSETRGGITQLLTLILNVSLVIGVLIPGLVFGSYKLQEGNPQSLEQGKSLTFKLMMIETIMAAICFIPNIFFQSTAPPTPPSASETIAREPFSQAIPKLMKNVNYILLFLAFGLYFGIFNAMSITLSYLIEPFFQGDSLPLAVAAVGGSPIISGIIGVIVMGPIQRRQKKYKKWIVICMGGSIFATSLFYPLLIPENLALASFISAFNSFFLIPLVPIMLEMGCELVFPVGEGSAVGLLFAVGNFGGFLLGIFLSMIAKGNSKGETAGGFGFCLGVELIGLILIYFMTEEKNRENFESEESERRRSSKLSMLSGSSDSETKKIIGDKRTEATSNQLQEYQHYYVKQDNALDNPLL